MNPISLTDCIFATWSPQIGDPTVMGWATVVSYLVAGILASAVFFQLTGRQRVFWFVLLTLLFALAINKQLDLQSALTAAARCVAQAQGWYDDRQSVQVVFIFLIVGVSVVATLVLSWSMRQELPHIWPALIGLILLLGFVAIRAAGFHHFDRFIGYEIGGVRMNWILELGGIAMIAANALCLLIRPSRNLR